ncbi:nSTAND1 domain-containing NTPase [Croceiramulus getboli]|nr:hypothetical protein P8624_10600 [Flavobacteriaceae bacterium YJPT1-3]
MAKSTHSNTQDGKTNPQRPFLGLRSFEEQHKSQFGGRDKEIEELFDLVGDHYLTVVYGDSGIGKTSLLKAGLMPRLRENFYFPIYTRIDFSAEKPPLDQLRDHIYSEMKELDDTIPAMGEESLWEYLHDLKLMNGLVTPVLLFDQFEELFTQGKNNDHVKDFVRELGDLAQNRIPASVKTKYKKQGKTVPSRYSKQNYHIVLSLREDYLARLDELKNHIPSIMNNGFRVVQMTISQALEAAIKPGKGLIDEPVAIEIIKKLPDVSQADFDVLNEKGSDKQALKVEPFLLSLICDQLNEVRIEKGLPNIDKKIVAEFNVDDVIKSFYRETLKKFDSNVELAIENLLLDADGFRKLQPLKEFQSEYAISDDDIVKLVNSRIIRQENRNNVDYIELIHDVLRDVIKKKRDQRERIQLYKAEKEAREKKAREEQKARELQEAKSRKRRRRILAIVGLIVVGVLATYGWMLIEQKKDLKQKQNQFWEIAKSIPSEKGFEAYLIEYPDGQFVESSLKEIESFFWNQAIQDTTAQRLEQFEVYQKEIANLKTNYKDYYDKNQFQYENKAKDSITKLTESRRVDERAWLQAKDDGSFEAYLSYIYERPNQKKEYLNRAVQKVKELGTSRITIIGSLGELRSGNAPFTYAYRQNPENITPLIGDILKAKISRNTYIVGTNLIRSGVWREGQGAYVSGVIVNADMLVLQILYKR